MGKYLKVFFGLFMVLGAVASGMQVMTGGIEDAARRIVENGVDAKGVIEYRTKHTVTGRYGRIGGRGSYYTMTYNFTTAEGKKYGGEINVTEEQAYAVSDGEEILVRYHANQPSINAPIGFKEYMTEEDVQNLPIGMMIGVMMSMLLAGLWLAWSGWRGIQSQFGLFAGSGSTGYGGQKVAQDRLSAISGSGSGGKPMFGKR